MATTKHGSPAGERIRMHPTGIGNAHWESHTAVATVQSICWLMRLVLMNFTCQQSELPRLPGLKNDVHNYTGALGTASWAHTESG